MDKERNAPGGGSVAAEREHHTTPVDPGEASKTYDQIVASLRTVFETAK